MRQALATLPWVEQDSIQTDVAKHEVRFKLKDKKAYNEEALKKALKAKDFSEVTVQSAPQ